jgi:nucleotide-binding universal stress UspA family protein
MKWIVGVDLRTKGHGALAVSAWLHAQGKTEQQTLGVHILEDPDSFTSQGHSLEDLERAALEAARTAMTAALEGYGQCQIELVSGESADEALFSVAQSSSATGIIVGRRARRGSDPYVRLGKTARRLLRDPVRPILICPPELAIEEIGAGPILVAVSEDEGCLQALRFADELGAAIGRKVALVNVHPEPSDWVGYYISPETQAEIRDSRRQTMLESFRTWAEERGLGDREIIEAEGETVPAIIEVARETNAPMIVCGSRRLGPLERFISSSAGRELAGVAPVPVVIVPPPDE